MSDMQQTNLHFQVDARGSIGEMAQAAPRLQGSDVYERAMRVQRHSPSDQAESCRAMSETLAARLREHLRRWRRAAIDDVVVEAAEYLEQIETVRVEGYIANVPDKCDRVVWRGRYHHLPIHDHRWTSVEVFVAEARKGVRSSDVVAADFQREAIDGLIKELRALKP